MTDDRQDLAGSLGEDEVDGVDDRTTRQVPDPAADADFGADPAPDEAGPGQLAGLESTPEEQALQVEESE